MSPVLTASGQPIYARTPRGLLRDPSISRDARLLWTILEDHTSKEDDAPWPSQERLAEYLGASDRSVRNWLNELVRAGWLIVEQRPGRSNRHHLSWKSVTQPRNEDSGPPRNEDSGDPGTGVPTKKNQEEEPIEEASPTPPEEGGQEQPDLFGGEPDKRTGGRSGKKRRGPDAMLEEFFARWWADYPSGGSRGSKPAAFRAYRKRVGEGFTSAELADSLENYRDARVKYQEAIGSAAPIMAGSKFLNQELDVFEHPLSIEEIAERWPDSKGNWRWSADSLNQKSSDEILREETEKWKADKAGKVASNG